MKIMLCNIQYIFYIFSQYTHMLILILLLILSLIISNIISNVYSTQFLVYLVHFYLIILQNCFTREK